MPVSSSTEHWIKPDALTIKLNHFGDPDYLQVSVLAGAVVMAFKQDVIGYNAAHNYRTWPLEAANTYLETSSAYNVYARLTRSEVNARALIVYDTVLRDIEGREITYAEDGSEVLGDASADYFFVFLGQVSPNIDSDGQMVQREWIVDPNFGSLDTNQQKNDTVGLFDLMFKPHYDNPLDPNEITWIEALTHLGVAGGITMYANGGKLNIPSIYDGLPIDWKTLIRDENGVLKLNPDIELGGGISSWDELQGKPSWITNSKPKYTYTEIEGTPDLSKYALVSQIPSLSGYATESWVLGKGYATTSDLDGRINALINGAPQAYDTLKEIADVLEGNVNSIGDILTTLGNKADKATTLGGYGITDAYTKVNVNNLLKGYVTIAGTEDVTGIHNFTNGIKVGGIVLKKFDDGVVYIDGNLVVKGGITMYGDENADIPTIYDGLPIDNVTLYWENTSNGKVLKSKVGTEGAITEITSAMVISALGFTPYDASNPNGYITSSALSGYATQTWVKNQGYLTSHQDLSGYQPLITSSNKLAYSLISGVPTKLSQFTDDIVSGNYLPMNGIAESATKLQTARTIWGQSFDGTGNVTNHLYIPNNYSIYTNNMAALGYVGDNLWIGQGTAATSNTQLCGLNTYLRYGGASNVGIALTSSGNVGIGTTSPSYKLDVNGFVYASTTANVGIKVGAKNDVVNLSLYAAKSGNHGVWSDTKSSWLIYTNGTNTIISIGYVGIGTTSPSSKLHVSGDILATGGITTNDSLTINGIKLSKSKEGVLYLDGNLVVKGGVTMYGTDATSSPSILDSLPIASTSAMGIAQFNPSDFVVKDGVVSFVGSVDGGVASSVAWGNITGKPTFATVATSGKYDDLIGKPTLLSSFTDDVVSGKYLPLKGGTITGRLYYKNIIHEFQNSDGSLNGLMRANSNNLQWYKDSTWHTVIHSGNYSSYALPLSGGTISGTYGALVIHRTNENSSLIKYSNSSGVLGHLGFNSSKEPFVYKGTDTTTQYKIWHEGNDGSGSGLDADMLDGYNRSSFHSLYGGSNLSASDTNNVDLNTLTSANSYYQPATANVIYVTNKPSSVTSAFRLYVSNPTGTSSTYLRQRIQQFNSIDIYERISTNSGSTWTDWTLVQTKLSSFTASSTLDGTLSITLGSISANVDNLYAKKTRFFTGQWNYNSGTTFDLNEWDTGGIVRCYGNSNNLLNRPDGFSYGSVLSLSEGTKALTGQLAWAVNQNSTTDKTKALWFRTSDSANGFTYSPWRKIAFTDSNVASATKLQTARTIWGQSFDGTGNVSGDLILGDGNITRNDESGTARTLISFDGNSTLFNYGLAGQGYKTYIEGNEIIFRYGTGHTRGMTILSSGNVGIGTAAPDYKFHVVGTTHINGEASFNSSVTLKGTSSSTARIIMSRSSNNYINYPTDGKLCLGTSNSTASTQLLIDGATGNVGIGTVSPSSKLHVSGDILATGGITMYSMRALKNVIDERGLSLSELSAIKPTRYTWKDNRDNKLHIGGIADDIEQVLPEVVYKTSEGILTMDYGNAAFAVAASLIKPVIDHENRIEMLEEENKQLRQEVERLKSA